MPGTLPRRSALFSTRLQSETALPSPRKSPREYQHKVQGWPYPASLEIKRVDANGMIRLEGQRLFVCEALVHREVGVERIGRKNALVSFRNMYIREIQLESGTSSAFIVPTSQVRT